MSFTILYLTYFSRVLGWAIRDNLGPALAEEVAQDVFLGYFRSVSHGSVVQNGNYGGYLYGIYMRVRPRVVKVLVRDRRIKAGLELEPEVY